MPRTKRQPVEPEFGRSYSIPTTSFGVKHDDYFRVINVSGGVRRSVYLTRYGSGERRRMALRKFQRRARPSPR